MVAFMATKLGFSDQYPSRHIRRRRIATTQVIFGLEAQLKFWTSLLQGQRLTNHRLVCPHGLIQVVKHPVGEISNGETPIHHRPRPFVGALTVLLMRRHAVSSHEQ